MGPRRPNSLIADANGDLFGTTQGGGANNDGTVFELVKSGSTYTLNALVSFSGVVGGHEALNVLLSELDLLAPLASTKA